MRTSEEFIADLRLIQESLRSHHGARLADGRLSDLLTQAEVFGFHLATLDVRQHADRHPRRWPRCSPAMVWLTIMSPCPRSEGSPC